MPPLLNGEESRALKIFGESAERNERVKAILFHLRVAKKNFEDTKQPVPIAKKIVAGTAYYLEVRKVMGLLIDKFIYPEGTARLSWLAECNSSVDGAEKQFVVFSSSPDPIKAYYEIYDCTFPGDAIAVAVTLDTENNLEYSLDGNTEAGFYAGFSADNLTGLAEHLVNIEEKLNQAENPIDIVGELSKYSFCIK